MKKLLISFLCLFLCATAYAKPLTLEEASEATCRIMISSGQNRFSWGSGIVIAESATDYFIMTNGHVVNDSVDLAAFVEFFNKGYKTEQLRGTIIFKKYIDNTSNDVALISLPKASLNGYTPRIIKLAPENTVVAPATMIRGVGSPNAKWMQSWEARVMQNMGDHYIINMAPAGGQSGTGVLVDVRVGDEDFTYTAGIITWRLGLGKEEVGGAVSLSQIYQVFKGQPTNSRKITNIISLASKENNLCDRCGKHRHDHVPIIYNGENILVCPDWYNAQCGPNGCFPHLLGPSTPNPPQVIPPPILSPDTNLQEKIDQLKNELERAKAEVEKVKELLKEFEGEGPIGKVGTLIQLYREYKNSKEYIEGLASNLKADKIILQTKIEEYKQKLANGEITVKEATEKIQELTDALSKKDEHPLDGVTGGNGEVAEKVSLVSGAATVGGWFVFQFLIPFWIKRRSKSDKQPLSTDIINALGHKGLEQIAKKLGKTVAEKEEKVKLDSQAPSFVLPVSLSVNNSPAAIDKFIEAHQLGAKRDYYILLGMAYQNVLRSFGAKYTGRPTYKDFVSALQTEVRNEMTRISLANIDKFSTEAEGYMVKGFLYDEVVKGTFDSITISAICEEITSKVNDRFLNEVN